MRVRGPTVILAALLAFLGLRTLPSGHLLTSSPDGKREKAALPADHSDAGEKAARPGGNAASAGLTQLFKDFGEPEPCAIQCKIEDWRNSLKLPGLQDWETQFLIVHVPDPSDSTIGYRFDSLIDAVQRAVETDDFVLDRFYYPWRRPGTPKPNLVDYRLTRARGALEVKASAHSDDGTAAETPGPGMLLFRSSSSVPCSKRRLLAAFLVGETATAGINKKAFLDSLAFITAFPGKRLWEDGTCEFAPFRVLGPYFSGSQTSLAFAVKAWKEAEEDRCHFHFISGSATGFDKAKFDAECENKSAKFEATVIPDQLVLDKLLKHIGLDDPDSKKRVAFLYESNTGYGSQFAGPKNRHGDGVVLFPFPLHISDVRTAYEKAGGGEKSNAPQLPNFGGKLRIDNEELAEPKEVEPSLFPKMTATMTERQLAATLGAISRGGFRYIAIAATDVRDQIFLASLIHEHCPNVRLMLLSSDLLLNHPDHVAYLKGALVGSTYPLYARNQEWSASYQADKRILFPGQPEQGYFNAAVALLDKPEKLLEYGPPFASAPSDSVIPSVWISILGQNGPHPLKVYDIKNEDREHYVYEAPRGLHVPTSFPPRHGRFWVVPFLCLLVFVAFAGSAFVRAAVAPPPASQPTPKLSFWDPALLREPQQLCYLWFIAASVNFLSVVSIAACLIWEFAICASLEWPWHGISPCGLLCIFIDLAILIFLLALLLSCIEASLRTMSKGQLATKFFVMCLLLVVLVSLALCCFAYFWYQPDKATFWFERATDLPSGVSPVVPIWFLALAFFWLSYCHLKRVYLIDDLNHSVPNPFPAKFTEETRCQEDAQLALKSPWEIMKRAAFVVAGSVVAIIVLQLWYCFVPTIEGQWYDWLMQLGFYTFLLLYAFTLAQTIYLWKKVRKLLEQVAMRPMRDAYRRLPDRLTGVLGPYLSSPRSRWDEFLKECDHQWDIVRQRHNTAWGFPPPAAAGIGATKLANAARGCLQDLNVFWVNLPVGGKWAPIGLPNAIRAWITETEDFAAMVVCAYLSQYFVHLRNLMTFLTYGAILLFLAIVSYPFHPQRFWLLTAALLLAVVAFFAVRIIFEIERDEVVSRIVGSKPNELNWSWSLAGHLALWVLPLLTALAALSADSSNLLHSWLDPVFQLFK